MMADFTLFRAEVSRVSLGKSVLQLNDHLNYIVNPELLGGTNSWNRQTTKSPYVDGEYTTNATLGIVEERIAVEVLGSSSLGLQTNIATLIEAFSQYKYLFTVRTDSSVWTYDCEAADYTVGWENVRRMVFRSTVQLQVRRQPKLVNGGF